MFTTQVSGVEMRKYMDDLLPIVMEMLQESSSLQKREVCYKRIALIIALCVAQELCIL